MNLIYAPSISEGYAKRVARSSGIEITPYTHERFSCGELFSKPKESLRDKRVLLLGTFNPHTFARDAVRLQIIVDGLKRMEIRGIDLILPNFPQPLELMPLFSEVDTLTSIELPRSAYLTREQEEELKKPYLSFLERGKKTDFGVPVTDLSAASVFCEYFSKLLKAGNYSLLDVAGIFDSRKMQQELASQAAGEYGYARMAIQYSKSGHKITGVKVYGDVAGRKLFMRSSRLNSAGRVRVIVDTLRQRQAEEVTIGITHAIFPPKVLRELTNNEGVNRVVTTDTIGIAGENQLKTGMQEQAKYPTKFEVLSTAEIIARAIKEKMQSEKRGGK